MARRNASDDAAWRSIQCNRDSSSHTKTSITAAARPSQVIRGRRADLGALRRTHLLSRWCGSQADNAGSIPSLAHWAPTLVTGTTLCP
jgi:hypothetical protein